MRLGRIGFDHVVGYLEHGVEALEDQPQNVATVRRTTATTLHEQIEQGDVPVVVDGELATA